MFNGNNFVHNINFLNNRNLLYGQVFTCQKHELNIEENGLFYAEFRVKNIPHKEE